MLQRRLQGVHVRRRARPGGLRAAAQGACSTVWTGAWLRACSPLSAQTLLESRITSAADEPSRCTGCGSCGFPMQADDLQGPKASEVVCTNQALGRETGLRPCTDAALCCPALLPSGVVHPPSCPPAPAPPKPTPPVSGLSALSIRPTRSSCPSPAPLDVAVACRWARQRWECVSRRGGVGELASVSLQSLYTTPAGVHARSHAALRRVNWPSCP